MRTAVQHPSVAGICDTDAELLGLAETFGVEVHVRDVRSRDSENFEDGFWDVPRFINRFDWLVNVNLCHPFVRLETLGKLIEAARTAEAPLLAVRQERGLLWGQDLQLLQSGADGPNTKTNPPYYVLLNLGGCYPVARMADGTWINANTRPLPLEVCREELIDIDTADDLEFACLFAKGRTCTES